MIMPGINPEQLKKVQAVSQHVSGIIRIDYGQDTVSLNLSASTPEAQQMIPALMDQFASSLATQLSAFFAIKGKIVKAGKSGQEKED